MSDDLGRRYYHSEEWEHGLRCAMCQRLFVDGDEYRESLFAMAEIMGDPVTCCEIVCVACDERPLDVEA